MRGLNVNIQKILEKLKIRDAVSVSVVTEGTASHVWKIVRQGGSVYAIRVMGSEHLKQFHREMNTMNHVRVEGLPVPEVYQVEEVEGNAVMVMEWVRGETVFQQLLEQDHRANEIGVKFGEMQAALHDISYKEITHVLDENWLTPGSSIEENIISKRSEESESHSLLHLDFHPLNVMIEETGIIDWTNSAIGEYKFDIARTLSILEIMGSQYFNEGTLTPFINGWREGYESQRGPLGDLSVHFEWAGERMKRDLEKRMDEQLKKKIDDWIHTRILDDRWD